MKIHDLLDMRKVSELIADGYIRERFHPVHPTLRILGYTEKAQWERLWIHETLTCRGLIFDAHTREILARPWPKFFNVGEHGQEHLPAELDMTAAAEVSDKMDGSLGIIFKNPYTDEWAVATRGSFDSDQARLANDQFLPAILEGVHEIGADPFEPMPGWTYLTEIIHSSNRIVLDYGDKQGLALLGAVNIETGEVRGPSFDLRWPDHVVKVFSAQTLAEALSLEPRPNAEGLVIRYLETGLMVKVKQEDYVRLHKIVTGLNDRAVWEHMSLNSGDVSGLIADVPDEFHEWLSVTAAGFAGAFAGITDKAEDDFERIIDQVCPAGPEDAGRPVDRKSFAELAKKNVRPHLMFRLLDGKPTDEAVWKELRPVGVRYMNEAAREEVLS